MANSLKEKLRSLRLGKGWSLDQLSEATGVSKSYLWELENRDKGSPSAEKLMKIAEVFNVTTEFLLDEKSAQPDDNVVKHAFFRKYDKLTPDAQRKINDIIDLWSRDDEPT